MRFSPAFRSWIVPRELTPVWPHGAGRPWNPVEATRALAWMTNDWVGIPHRDVATFARLFRTYSYLPPDEPLRSRALAGWMNYWGPICIARVRLRRYGSVQPRHHYEPAWPLYDVVPGYAGAAFLDLIAEGGDQAYLRAEQVIQLRMLEPGLPIDDNVLFLAQVWCGMKNRLRMLKERDDAQKAPEDTATPQSDAHAAAAQAP